MKRSPKERVVLVVFCRRGPLLDRLLAGVLHPGPVPASVKSETPSSRARRGVRVSLAMLDFGESRWVVLETDLAKCEERLPPYVEDGRVVSISDAFLSGVNGEGVLLLATPTVLERGEGVNGIRPPAVREEKSPMWDFIGVDTTVAILQYLISVERQMNVSIDDRDS